MLSTFRKVSFSLLSLLFIYFTACRNDRIPHLPDTLVVATDSSPTNLDPRIGIDKASEDFHHLLFNGLLKKDDQDRMVPDLAESFEKIGSTLFRFHLRKNVRFHDGRMLTARDVVFTYNSIFNGAVPTTKKATLDSIASVSAPAPDIVEIRLKAPFNGLLSNLNIGIIPENSSADFASHPIGTGPYKLLSFQRDEGASLEANSGYYSGAPVIRYLKIRIIPDATTRALELRKGGVDLAFGPGILPPDYFQTLRKDADLNTMTGPGNNYAYLGFNLRDPILSNKKVRQAIVYAIHRDELIDDLFYGAAYPATGLLAPHHWAYEGNVLRISYNVAQAKRLLDEAGYPDPDGDGPRVRFHLSYKVSTVEFRKMVATIIQSDLARVGIGLDVRSFEWGTFFSDINHGNFQICMLMWVGESDPDIYRNIFSTNGPKNRGKYSDPEMDVWLQNAEVAETEAEQKKYYSLIQKKAAEDCPYMSLWYEANQAVFRKELKGLKLTPDADMQVLKDVYWENQKSRRH
ncbi:MAG: hypothetical protein C5B54_10990 [Acidobacteria bacterium]|nr:MAG: hypothetical protein C5B54_10990 [Acidobacteriota bacterium]